MKERRRYERVALFRPLHLAVLPDGPVVPGSSFDISIGGVGVATELVLEPGQAVRVRFHFQDGPHGGTDEEVLGQVAYTRVDEAGNRMGIEFLSTIQESTQPRLLRTLSSL
ncbi:MAG: PilZ domain-containing protein [Thermoguttaceae bacterium]|jgi:c-di-GMP-binding flagellar brake protein YcgR